MLKHAKWEPYVLVDEENGNVLALLGEAVKGLLDGVGFGLVVYNEVVLLSIRWVGNVLHSKIRRRSRIRRCMKRSYTNTSEQDAGHRVLEIECQRCRSESALDSDHLIANNSKELAILVCGLWKSHIVLFPSSTRNVAVARAVCRAASWRSRRLTPMTPTSLFASPNIQTLCAFFHAFPLIDQSARCDIGSLRHATHHPSRSPVRTYQGLPQPLRPSPLDCRRTT